MCAKSIKKVWCVDESAKIINEWCYGINEKIFAIVENLLLDNLLLLRKFYIFGKNL